MTKKGEYIKSKTYQNEIKSPVMIYADAEAKSGCVDSITKISIAYSKKVNTVVMCRNNILKKNLEKKMVKIL